MQMECGHWRGRKANRLKPHYNDGVEIVHVVAGHVHWMVEDVAMTVAPGSLFITLPWQRHGGVRPLQAASEIRWILVPLDRDYRHPRRTFRFDPALKLALDDAEQRQLARTLSAMDSPCHRAGDVIPAVMPATVAALRAREQDEPLCRALVQSVLVAATRAVAAAAPPPQPPDHAVGQALAEIRQRCAEPWSLARMAAYAGYGRTRFAEQTRILTGESPLQYLNRCRVEHAEELLRTTDRPITDIALSCGFSSSQYFARVFKSFTYHDARTWRAAHRSREGANAGNAGD